jgi:hypothetical protein
MIGASVGVAVLAWMFASRNADDVAARQRSRADAAAERNRRGSSGKVLELPRSVHLTSADAEDLRAAAAHLEAHGGDDAAAHRLREIASRVDPGEELRSARKGS